jgi:glycosyltransferase involved in cell wall biosynthesis
MASIVDRVTPYKLSIVIPCFNEGQHLAQFINQLKITIQVLTPNFEILIINDGSRDNTRDIALSFIKAGHIRYIEFSRNFGKESALMAGINLADGDAVLLIDSDFQHPLDKIIEMELLWKNGNEMIYGVIISRLKESWWKKLGTQIFYSLMNSSEVAIPANAGDFRWLDRRVVNALKQLPERNRFMKGLYAWVGFQSIALPFEPNERKSGNSSFGVRRLTRLALSGLASFSTIPLQFWIGTGILISGLAVAYGFYVVIETFIYGNPVSGWPTLTVAIMFFSGIQLLSIGILGEYIGQIYNEVKQRPLYLISDDISSENKNNIQHVSY